MTIAEFANTLDPDEMANTEPSYVDLHCLPSNLRIFNIIQFELKFFGNFAVYRGSVLGRFGQNTRPRLLALQQIYVILLFGNV